MTHHSIHHDSQIYSGWLLFFRWATPPYRWSLVHDSISVIVGKDFFIFIFMFLLQSRPRFSSYLLVHALCKNFETWLKHLLPDWLVNLNLTGNLDNKSISSLMSFPKRFLRNFNCEWAIGWKRSLTSGTTLWMNCHSCWYDLSTPAYAVCGNLSARGEKSSDRPIHSFFLISDPINPPTK